MSSTLVKHSQRTLRKPRECCGTTDVYWSHDTDRTFGESVCTECTDRAKKEAADRGEDPLSVVPVRGKWVLVNTDMSRHRCLAAQVDQTRDSADVDDTPAPKVESAPKVSATGDAGAQLMAALQAAVGTPAIDRAEVEKIVRAELRDQVFPTRTVIIKDNVRREIEGTTHVRLGDVVTTLSAGLHVMMVGPAGTGKSTIAHQAADALGIKFYSIPCNPQMPASQLMGYKDATGNYRDTPFRQAFEHGGVFLFDEIDNSNASVLASMNGALANGHMTFPDGLVKRHPDFRAIGAANTYGMGATRQYVGRTAIDGATLDRFAMLTIEIDESLESIVAMSLAPDDATAKRVIEYVRRLRRNANDMKVIISPRATFGMCQMLSVNMSWDAAVDACVRKGMTPENWRKVGG